MLTSCGEYREVLKNKDLDFKLAKAVEYYDAKSTLRRFPYFDELITLHRGTDKAQEVYFYYANTLYFQKDYILAGYHFKNFYKTFPSNYKAEEAAYLTAYCYYLESTVTQFRPSIHLQGYKRTTIVYQYASRFERIEDCNEYMENLRGRLRTKKAMR